MIDTYGQNIHVLLKDGFFLSSFIGECAKEEINKIINKIKSEPSKEKNERLYSELSEEEYESYKKKINIIGEDIFKDKLLSMLDICYYSTDDDNKRKKYTLERKKKKIEKEIEKLNPKG